MSRSSLSVVTGAFGYSGKYIARRLLEQGATVKTLTRTPTSHSPFGDRVEALPLDFGDFNGLVENLRGAATLYNTYWIRFARGTVAHDVAVQNSRILIGAAAEAAVSRIVHISITNPSEDSPLPYFTSGGRRWWRRQSTSLGCPTPSSDPRCCSAPRMC